MRLRFAPILALLLSLAAPVWAQEFPRELAEARAALVKELEGLARLAFKSKLFRERDRTYGLILGLDSDHVASRRALRYRKGKDGRWERRRYKEPRNGSEKGLADFTAARRKILSDHATRVLALLEAHVDTVDSAIRATTLDQLVLLAPELEAVRKAAGHVSHEGRWVMRETRLALQRRAKIAAHAREALAKAGAPETSEISTFEKDLGAPFTGAFVTPDVRVVASTTVAEATASARAAQAVGPFFRKVFEVSTRHRSDYRIYLLGDPQHKVPLLQNHPRMTPEVRKFVEKLLAAWVPGRDHLIEWGERAELRLDGVVRQTIGTFMIDSFGRVDIVGWTAEGFGLYLGHHLVGTRLTWFVEPSRYARGDDELRARLLGRKTNWLAEAAQLVESGKAPDLRGVVGRKVNDMGARDTLIAHGLAAFLLEAYPQEVGGILRAIGEGESSVTAIEAVLDTSLPVFEKRFHRWLGEARKGP